MKIGYLIQQEIDIRTPPFDGPATHVREVVRGLTSRGHLVRVLFRLNGRIWSTDDLQRFEPVAVPLLDKGPLRLVERAIRRVQYELRLPYAAWFESLRFALACRRCLTGFDLLLERMSWVSYGGALAGWWLRIPLVLENNGDPLDDLEAKGIAPRGMQLALSIFLMDRMVRRAAHVTTSGDGWRQRFLERWQTPPGSVTTVENGTTLVERLSRRELRSFQPDPPPRVRATVVYVGGFQPWQGVPILLRALKIALDREATLRLVLIGSGPDLEAARRQVGALGLEELVTFTGRLQPEDYAPLLAAADIAAAPYCGWPESSGLKLFDYKAAGLAIIASGSQGYPRTLEQGRTALIVPPCDPEALAAALLCLASDPEKRRAMGRAARVDAERKNTWLQTVLQLETLLSQVAATQHDGNASPLESR